MKKRKNSTHLLPVLAFALIAAILICAAILVFPNLFSKKEPVEKPAASSDTILGRMIASGEEVSGVYVATVGNLNYPSSRGLSGDQLKAELDDIVATCSKASINTIIFQVRPMCDALYYSDLFPSSAYLSGTQGVRPEVDVLAELVLRAHANNIAVAAWVNPLRVIKGDLDSLSPDNPAAVHRDWCVEYGGTYYFDAGIPEVRKLVSDGCAEIAAGYDVDAILFDDYFYPYPKDGEEFDDDETFAKFGGGESIADWRRGNVNKMIAECHTAVKAANADCLFGIAPFGIWSNDNGKNGGSATRGLDAYNDIYCDALAWVKDGSVDFLAPQLYWSFSTAAAPYNVVCDWWAQALKGTGVVLMSSNAAYRITEWEDPDELEKQVAYTRQNGEYAGVLYYSYAVFKDNVNDVVSCVARINAD